MYKYFPSPLKRKLLVVIIILLAASTLSLSVVLYGLLIPPGPVDAVPLAINDQTLQRLVQNKPTPHSALPVRLKIPKINVNASLDYVSLTADGAMGVPKGRLNAAWFELGPRPGDVGSAVIDGHFGWKDGLSAVFDNLHQLRKGDELSVESQDGSVIKFVVTELRIYDQNQDASDVFSSNDGQAHLNLITCEGVWSKTLKSYASRLIVFTDKKE